MRRRLNQAFWFFTNPFTDYRRIQIVYSSAIASFYLLFWLGAGVSNQTWRLYTNPDSGSHRRPRL